jgi:CheY-like chemotaxis protein
MSPLRVILIDDDHLVRAVLAEWLRDAGFQVTDFSDPREALGTFGSGHPPHVLITDVDLGSALNGFDVADAAHQLWPAVSVILISGMPAGHTAQKLDPRDRYLQKPFSDGCLLRALEQLTGLTGRT